MNTQEKFKWKGGITWTAKPPFLPIFMRTSRQEVNLPLFSFHHRAEWGMRQQWGSITIVAVGRELCNMTAPVPCWRGSVPVALMSVGGRRQVCGSPPPPPRANRPKAVTYCQAGDICSWEIKIKRNRMVWRVPRAVLVQTWMGQGLCVWIDIAWQGSWIAF